MRIQLKQMVFRNLVLSSLMSVMISFTLLKHDLERLNETLALARGSLAGCATIQIDGVAHKIKTFQSEVRTFMIIVTSEAELDIARVGFWQEPFRNVNHHQQ